VDRRHKALAVPIISVTTREAGSTTSTDGADDDSNSASSPIARASASEPEEGVFALRDGRAVWTPVTLGITGQEHFEILSGLALGDTVVSGPYQTIRSLTDGDPVRAAADAEPSP
jgi:HlyD family secretion protein